MRFSQRIFILAGFAIIPLLTFAQAVSGKVVEASSGEPLPFANVVLMRDSVYIDGVVSGDDGCFFFGKAPAGADRVKITMVGYGDFIGNIPPTGDFGVIALEESSVMLGEVVVKADLPATRLTGNVMVTTVAGSVLSKAGTANDVLAKIPLVTGGDGNFKVFGRGAPVIYINGRKVTDASSLEQLSSEDIKSVEVISNPGPQYPADVNAVIRIKTLPPKGEGFSLSAYSNTMLATFARNSENLDLKYRVGGLEVFANGYFYGGKWRFHDISALTTYGPQVFDQQVEAYTTPVSRNLYGKLGFNYQAGQNHSFGAYYQAGKSRVSLKGTVDTRVTSDGAPYESLWQWNDGDETELPDHNANVYYTGSFGKLSVDFNGDFLQTETSKSSTKVETGGLAPDQVVLTDAVNRSRMWAEKLVLSYPLWKGSIEVGEEFTDSRVSYNSVYHGAGISGGDTEIKESGIAAFAEMSQSFGPVQLGVGLRYEHVRYRYFEGGMLDNDLSRTYDNWFPSLTASAQAGQVGLSFNLTSRTRRPSYRQLDGTVEYVNRYSYQAGNPALKPTRMYTAQLMAQWRYFFAQAIYNHENNSVFYTTERYENDPLVKLVIFENVPLYRQFQFAVGAQPTVGCWSTQPTVGVFCSFYTTEFLGREKRLDKPFLYLNWSNTVTLPKGWTVDADFMAQTAGHGQNCYIKATSYLNIGVTKRFFNDSFSVKLEARDIFDTANERVKMYNGDILVSTANYQGSRNLRLTLRYRLNASRSKYRGTGAGSSEKDRL